jgi:hypothetical protein
MPACAGGVALQEVAAAIFKIVQTKYMLTNIMQVAWHFKR